MSTFPLYFTLNDRPVKVVLKESPDGFEILPLALNMRTGDWEPAEKYYDRYLRRDGDIDVLTEPNFKELVAGIKKELGLPNFE